MINFRFKELKIQKERSDGKPYLLKEIAKMAGVSYTTIHRISRLDQNVLRGIRAETIEKLILFFGCTPNDFIVVEPDEETAETSDN